MSDVRVFVERHGRELHDATRDLASESLLRSWWHTLSTFGAPSVVLISASVVLWWPLRLALSVLGGLILIRAFVLYCMISCTERILSHSRLGKLLFHVFGLLALDASSLMALQSQFPPRSCWQTYSPEREGQFSRDSRRGAVPLMSTQMWQRATVGQRLWYRISRHPVTILSAYVTVFLLSICVLPTLRNPRKFWDGAVSLAGHIGLLTAVWIVAGFPVVFFSLLIPSTVAAALGAYLFFAQHNYEGLRVMPIGQWSHFSASLESRAS